jgi:hypothetical protein
VPVRPAGRGRKQCRTGHYVRTSIRRCVLAAVAKTSLALPDRPV